MSHSDGDLAAEHRGHRALAVEVDDQHPVAVERGGHREMRGRGGLADPALEVRHRHDLGRQPGRAPGAVFLGAAALGGEMRAQAQHLVEGEPFRAPGGLGPALRQGGVGAEHPAEMRGRHRDQVFGDLPGGEQPQAPPAVRVMAAGDEIPPAFGAAPGDLGEVRRAHRRPQLGERLVGRDVEIRRQGVVESLGHRVLAPHVLCFLQCSTIRGIWKNNRHPGCGFEANQAFAAHSDSGSGQGANYFVCYEVLDSVLRGGGCPLGC